MEPLVERYKVSLINFLLEVTPPLLGCSRQQLQRLLSQQTERVLKPFLLEAQPGVLVVGKEAKPAPETREVGAVEDAEDGEENYALFVELGFVPRVGGRVSSVAFLKRPGFSLSEKTRDGEEGEERDETPESPTSAASTKPIGQQLALLRCGFGGEESFLELTQLYMQRGFTPLLKSAIKEDVGPGGGDGTGEATGDDGASRSSHGVEAVQKKLTELTLALQQAQQNVDIPLINLPIDPVIRNAVQAAAEEKRKPVVEDIGDRLQDSAYLMSLQSHVNKWIKDIQKVCRMQRDPTTITTSEEVSFWLGFERALKHLEDQLKTPEAELTLAVLKHTRKVFATMSFEQDSGLRQAMEIVQNTNVLMRDFPLNDLIGAMSVEQLTLAVRTVFSHLKKLKNANLYPLSRAFLFVEAMSRDLTSQLLSILSKQNLLRVAFDEFEHVTAGCSELFRTWDEEVRHFKEMARELAKKRGLSERPPSKLVCEHVILQERLLEVRQFRRQHHRLKEVLSRVLSDEGRSEIAAEKDVDSAYQLVESVDALDLTRGGEQAWETTQKAYDSRIDRVESQITAKLRDRLGASKTSLEMFRVFSQFNAIFFRPRIRGAVQEYQTKLIQQVKDDLKQLQSSYIDGSQKLESSTMAMVRDMPQVAGAVVWTRQLEHRLDGLLQRTEDVLGKGWEAHVEGQKLKHEIDSFRARLNQQALFDSWLNAVKDQKRLNTSDRVFAIRDWGAGRLELVVNFDPDILTLFKEVRLLSTLQFRIPYSVKVMADEAKVLYPFVVALQEVLRTFEEGCFQVGEDDAAAKLSSESLTAEDSTRQVAALLVAAHRRDVQTKLSEGMSLRWDSDRLEAYVKRLAEVVYIFEAKTEFALQRQLEVAREIESIKDKSIEEANSDSILGVLCGVQKRIEEIQLQNFSNVGRWAKILSSRVEDILKRRLEALLQEWTEQFEQWPNKGTGLIQNGLVLEIQVRSHVLQVHPAVDAARQLWMGALNRAIASVCLLPRFNSVHSSRTLRFGGDAEAWEEEDSEEEMERQDSRDDLKPRRNGTFRNIAFEIPRALRERAVGAIDKMMEKVEAYVENWLHFQVLWDVDVSDVLSKLGDDIETWQQLLNEVKQARTPFDSGETRVVFGPTIVDHRQVQAKLNTKYDAWHREILNAFGQKVAANSRALFASLRSMVSDLEELGRVEDPTDSRMTAATFFSLSDTQAAAFVGSQGIVADELVASLVADITKFVDKLNEAGALEPQWRSAADALRASEVLLERQRFAFPSDWLWTDAVEGQSEVFQQLLRHHVQLLDQSKEQVLVLVRQYSATVDDRLKQLYSDWMSQRPMSNQLVPSNATAILARFEQRLEKLQQEHKCCARARKVLGLEGDAFGLTQETVSPAALEEEIADMKGVWLALSGLQADLTALRDTLWVAVVPRSVRSHLESLIQRISEIPARFRQYEAFEELRQKLNGYLSLNMLITDMKTDALKDRHWRVILNCLKLRKNVSDLTLASLWDADLGANEAVIRDVLLQAQGESALEEFLRQVRDSWRDRELQMVAFGNKCKLVKGWDELFQVIDDQLAALQSMRVSPFFKIFEEEALAWDEKLSRLRSLLDSWVDVQRKWLYLEGVFTGSQDIQLLLPAEYQRFKGIDTDFKSIMKKADTTKIVMDMAATDGLGRQLERLSDSLARIQKALGEYLEKQREQFSRFYFVGDEDLLEMIGNAKDVKVVQKHVNKLFAGIAALETDPEDPATIVAMRSREGEVVPFVTSVSILQYVSLKDWLSAVEVQMVVTLADCVSRALRSLEQLDLPSVARQQLTSGAGSEDGGGGEVRVRLAQQSAFLDWVSEFPVQALLLALDIHWTKQCEAALTAAETDGNAESAEERHPLETAVLDVCIDLLGFLADRVVLDVGPLVRHRMVHVITQLVHQRDVCRTLVAKQVRSIKSFHWLQCMRHYFTHPTPSTPVDPSTLLKVCMADASFNYGFEYLGLAERLVLTPLTDKCFLTLTQALSMKLGGNPFGPAGTGKTESVKALGAALGRYTLVFNCDETFDFHAMGRIFSGLCQVGAWGCFDEFNRLDERILSAVSEQILTIQTGLREGKKQVELLGKATTLNGNVGIFVTMNPGYAGRSNLPDNLKQLFREVAMINPDKQLIAQVTLFAQGFRSAERLASKIISLYDLCDRQLSKQPHYDFGLRSLKSALNSAGSLKRQMLQKEASEAGRSVSAPEDVELVEQQLLLRSVTDTVVPKLVAQDVPLLKSLLLGVFPDADVAALEERALTEEIGRLCQLRQLQPSGEWMDKVLQLFQIQKLQHGVMLVGPVGTGKSCAWRVLLDAMEKVDGVKGVSYVLDPKVVPKEQLYGKLDSTTLEWQDGVFTAVLRKILSSSQETGSGACSQRRHWIVFDGDVDPDWAENLNSALDDNKLLTLPNGERLEIPSNVRIIFEVETLKFATLATVSRCGIVWFSESVLPDSRLFEHQLAKILCGGGEVISVQTLLGASTSLERRLSTRQLSREVTSMASVNLASAKSKRFGLSTGRGAAEAEAQLVREACVQALEPYFVENGFASQCLQCAERYSHIMTFTKIRSVESTFSLIRKGINRAIDRAAELRGEGLSVDLDVVALFITKWMVLSILWGMGGSLSLASRSEFSSDVARLAPVPLPASLAEESQGGGDSALSENTLLDFEPFVEDGQWHHWSERVTQVEIDTSQVKDASLVIQTVDTVRHRDVVAGWLDERKPFILCGPPGSGKTMTLTAVLKERTDFDIAFLNFSSGTSPDLLLKTFDHYCEFSKTASGGMVMRPAVPGKSLIVFCDECNLPLPDKYGTQTAIMLIRQIAESGGFWRLMPQQQQTTPWVWVRVEGVQFAGACNPPTDAGRHPMSNRFLRHAPIIFVDFPGKESLKQIYRTFNRALLRPYPSVSGYAEALTQAMVEFYVTFSRTFTIEQQPHYIYSPRELTRWKLALAEAFDVGVVDSSLSLVKRRSLAWTEDRIEGRTQEEGSESVSLERLVRTYIHEGLRIFKDRLVTEDECQKTDAMIDDIAKRFFVDVDESALQRPILFTYLGSRRYSEVTRQSLRSLLQGKLRVFNEEVFNVQLVFFDEVLDHVTRIDRVLRQPLGHLLLVGASGAGKTILTKFVAWINGLSIFQIKAGRNYSTESFEHDLRNVMKRAAIKEEKIAFIIDESNSLGPAFLERMNALLASGEVPGLFEGDEYTSLINECKAAYGSDYLGSNEATELFGRFTKQVQRNLHIIFTMNPANPDFYNRQATSPALFNRCVIDWFGEWSRPAMTQVAYEFTNSLPLPPESFTEDAVDDAVFDEKFSQEDDGEVDVNDNARRVHLAKAIVAFYFSVVRSNKALAKVGRKSNFMTPRDFLDFLHHFRNLVDEKSDASSEQQHHLQAGLQTLARVEQQVGQMRAELTEKEGVLKEKNQEAECKMQQMVDQQAEAEEKKRGAEILARKLDEQTGVIAERKDAVQEQLSAVEPLLKEAAEAVTNIPKKSLDELKSMANPPAMAKAAVEAVAVLITDAGEKPVSWEDARKILKAQDFITKVLNFDCASVSAATRKRIQSKFLTGDWEIERINKASKAAGPLAQWVESSVKFVAISEQVQPLQTEITTLQKEAQDNEASLQEQQTLIAQLEAKLHQYKEDYAQLISQVQSIKREMDEVQKKCARSMALLENLGSEKTRWFEQLEVLQLATQTFVGDSLLAAAFCAYLGFFEYADRHRLIDEWRAVLTSECIRFRVDLSFVEFLSTPSERLQWAAHSLSHDDLSIENAIILKRFLRYPLIIDPSGQAINFLMSFLASRKLARTSFVDSNFLKNLESSLRFGSTLLIHDVEKVDPILNPVLNKETHKIGGRVMITVGDSEIDLSPSFSMYMATRDPSAQFTPDLCSRVTMVNFTLTPSSLVNQCLNMILKSERPDIDKRRSDMLKLQGEFKVKIRELEDALLHALSNVKGNILDDDSVMSTMETLKQQAAEVAKEAARTEQVMTEVEQTSNMYLPWALAAGRIYFTLLNLSCVSFLYQYDSQFFIGILQETLSYAVSQNDIKTNDYTERLNVLLAQLFTVAYRRVAYSLSYSDRLVYGLQLAFIRVELDIKAPLEGPELQLLFQGLVEAGDSRASEVWTEDLGGHLSPEQSRALQKLLSIEPFSDLQREFSKNVEKWVTLLNATSPEDHFPEGFFEGSVHPLGTHTVGVEGMTLNAWIQLIRKVLLLKALRPDRVSGVLIEVCESILGRDFLTLPELTQELIREFVEKKASSTVPVLFVTSPGFDSSGKINQLAVSAHQTLASVAMGSKEGFTLAEKAISVASRQGAWVLLKNVHLSPKWLEDLEKKLNRMEAHANFRLFLTMEHNPKVPASLIRMCCTFVFEPPSGIKASLVRSYATLFGLAKGRCQGGSVNLTGSGETAQIRAPAVARCRLQFLLAFLHAVILERKRYAPVGWCKLYEFSDADQRCALKVLDSWIDSVAQRGNVLTDHVAPERLPWNAIRTLISQVCYGGRLDNDVDNRILQSFVDHLFRPEAFESSFCLNMPVCDNSPSHSNSVLKAPELFKNNMDYLSWVDSLPSRETPEWFGFSSRAEWLLASREGTSIINNWSTLLLRGQEEALDFLGIAQSANSKDLQRVSKHETAKSTGEKEEVLSTTSWLTLLIPVVNTLLLSLPDSVEPLERTDELVQNPLFRCFERELGIGIRLYCCVKTSLKELLLVCKGEEKMTNSLRDLATLISSSKVPSEWSQHYVSYGELTVAEWLDDFKRRLLQLSVISQEFCNNEGSNSTRQTCMEQLSRQRDDGALTCKRIWLGGLFFPSVYLTATRQSVAQANGWSLDDLFAEVALGIDTAPDDQGFVITGLTIEGAAWNAEEKCLDLTEAITGNLPPMLMRWYHKTQGPMFNSPGKKLISIPLFLNRSRRDVVSFISLPFPLNYPESLWIQRATAVFLWTNF